MQAVLFDLDGTLLDIDMDRFLPRYFGALGPVLAAICDTGEKRSIDAVIDATAAMMRPHPGQTNRTAFDARFREITGIDLAVHADVIDDFYSRVFPALGDGIGPRAAARESVVAAIGAGLRVVLATNPIFPAHAVEERMRWAGLDDVAFSLVTTYENMHACKPDPAYFAEIAAALDVDPAECLMVGDDTVLDMAAGSIGMRTFFVGESANGPVDYVGDLRDLIELMPVLGRPAS